MASARNQTFAVIVTVALFMSCPTWSAVGERSGIDASCQIQAGVVVENISGQGGGGKAGLQPGDVLLTWSRGESKGEIQSPLDLLELEAEQSPRGPVRLEGLRGQGKESWALGDVPWQLVTRANFSAAMLPDYLDGLKLAKGGAATEITQGTQRWTALAVRCSGSPPSWLGAWLFSRAAEVMRDAHQWKQVDDGYRSAIQAAAGMDSAISAQLLQSWAKSYQQRSDWASAEKYFQESISKSE